MEGDVELTNREVKICSKMRHIFALRVGARPYCDAASLVFRPQGQEKIVCQGESKVDEISAPGSEDS